LSFVRRFATRRRKSQQIRAGPAEMQLPEQDFLLSKMKEYDA
jgi:hypothetical protein